MGIQFFDLPADHLALLPLSYTRPLSEMRVGILTIREKWLKFLNKDRYGFSTEDYLSVKYPSLVANEDTLWISGGLLPDDAIVSQIKSLKTGEFFLKDGVLLAGRGSNLTPSKTIEYNPEISKINKPWDVFLKNGLEIRKDIHWVKTTHQAKLSDPHTVVYGDQLYVEPGAIIRAAILNTESGPIYIGKNAEVQEGSIIRGPFALCENSVISLGAKIRPDSTVGPFSKVGGEFSNSVIFGYSNKAHDGFIGNSVIGEWCNIGADTNNSNLKNNYGEVKMWDYVKSNFTGSGLQFCGLIMGDHSKTGINTMLNTGTSVGVSCSVFGAGFPPNPIPSFSWGGSGGLTTFRLAEALETARRVLDRRKIPLSSVDESILHSVFNLTLPLRH